MDLRQILIITPKFLKNQGFFLTVKTRVGAYVINVLHRFPFLFDEHKMLERTPSTNVEEKLHVTIAQIQVWN